MPMINNQTSLTLNIEVHNSDGSSYTTSIPPGGSWAVPEVVSAVNMMSIS
ncbi:MAG: hypothetical protein AAGM22_08755 [Acidobacteriota bacterium]